MTAPDPGFPHPEWPDVLDAEAWARIRCAVHTYARCERVALFFCGVRAAR